MICDEMLAQAAAKAAALINEGLPEASVCNHHFSTRFVKKMKRIIHRANHPLLYRTLRSAACILLLMMFGFGSVLTISVDAREAVFGWARAQYDSFYTYFFDGTSYNEDSTRYCPGWVPEGNHLITVYEIDGGETYIYYDRNDGITQFSYSSNSASLEMYIQCVGYEEREVNINGFAGVLYVSPNNSEASELVWQDDEKGVIFNVSAHVSEEILVKMAEKIVVNKIHK